MACYYAKSSISNVFLLFNFDIIIKLNIFFFPLLLPKNNVSIFCVEPESEPEPPLGAGALIESEALKKTPDGPKRGGEKASSH